MNINLTKKFFLLFLATFLIRASIFYFYIQHEERYQQADSMDYHIGGLCIALGHGMYNPGADRPIFWRTPGYPAYLATFYNFFGITDTSFEANSKALKASIWVQIFLSSLLPILIFYLALILLNSLFIAWAAAWISVFHIGFILSSTYILTEGLATVFFVAYLLCFFLTLKSSNIPHPLIPSIFRSKTEKNVSRDKLKYLISSAILLAIFTWIRPMGQTLAIVSLIILLFSHLNLHNWKKNLFNSGIFFIIFFT